MLTVDGFRERVEMQSEYIVIRHPSKPNSFITIDFICDEEIAPKSNGRFYVTCSSDCDVRDESGRILE